MANTNSLLTEQVQKVLGRLYESARGDRYRLFRLSPKLILGRLRGTRLDAILSPSDLKDIYLPISREQGEFLYLTARASKARRIVEFGTSFGISTIYLASAVKDNGGGVVIGTELEPSKRERAMANFEEAGLGDVVEVRLGDALETLRDLPEPIDMVLLDGWKDLYLPVLELVKPRLRHGSLVLADNVISFKKSLRSYLEHVKSGKNGFQSTTLKMADGFEYSVYTG